MTGGNLKFIVKRGLTKEEGEKAEEERAEKDEDKEAEEEREDKEADEEKEKDKDKEDKEAEEQTADFGEAASPRSTSAKRPIDVEDSDDDPQKKKAKIARDIEWKQIMQDRFRCSPFGFAF